MNKFKVILIKNVLKFYLKKRSFKIRAVLKKMIGNKHIELDYEGINLLIGIQSSIESNIFFNEYGEKNILELIKYFAKNKYNFIDVGANIGIHTLTAAMVNTEIEVFSFEPEPGNFKKFIKNMSINNCSNIRPFKLGIGNYIGFNKMNVNDGWNKGKHSMKVDFGVNQKQISIPISQLDVFKDNIPKGSLMIKIDVEGFEKEVIEGGLEVLGAFENIFLIIELLQETNGLIVCQEITSMLKNNNFSEVYKIYDNGRFEKVIYYQGSSDYVFLKGAKSIKDFKIYNEKCEKA